MVVVKMYQCVIEWYLNDRTNPVYVVAAFNTTTKGILRVYFFLAGVTVKQIKFIFDKRISRESESESERVAMMYMLNDWWW